MIGYNNVFSQQHSLVKLIILDRDGVINEDSDDYIKSPQEWIPITNSLAAISRLNRAGYIVAVATNQSGISRGYYSLLTLQHMHTKMHQLLSEANGHIDAIEFCPHVADDHCTCRKPQAGMLLKLMHQFDVEKQDTLFIGDTLTDFAAAKNAGIAFMLLRTGKGERILAKQSAETLDVAVFADLSACVTHLLNIKND